MKDLSSHKLKFNPYLERLYQSDKPLIIYKVNNGYNIYTDFSKKIILKNNNIVNFLKSFSKKKYKKETDLFIGFFGYELLNNLIGVKVPQQRDINFPKGIFYKPEKKISLNNKLIYNAKIRANFKKKFKINIDSQHYKRRAVVKLINQTRFNTHNFFHTHHAWCWKQVRGRPHERHLDPDRVPV